jgi:large subunit ribosomal protein L9
MKLLLRKDIDKLGLCGDVVEVSSGYARNYLLPHHLALEPTSANLKSIEVDKQVAAQERERIKTVLKQTAQRLTGAEVTISAACTPDGHLYGSVGPREISHALMQEGHSVHADQIKMSHNLKEVGAVEIPVVLSDEIRTSVKVWIVAEKAVGEIEEGTGTEDKDDQNRTAARPADQPADAGSPRD